MSRPANVIPLATSTPTLPGARDRLAVLGRTGSGKTHFACWVLSQANWPSIPWFVIDYKRDDLLAEIPGARELAVTPRRLPRESGIYIVHPRPDEEDEVERLLWRIWERGRAGLYVDEGHMLPDRGGLQAMLTQGRSKSIPVIVLTQRPSWVNRFVFSEADYFSVFHLNDKRDRATIGAFMPAGAVDTPLPARHSWYYDIARNRLYHMLPVPSRAGILARFEARLPRRIAGRFV